MCGSEDALREKVAGMSLREMKNYLDEQKVDYKDCIEKKEIVERVVKTMADAAKPKGADAKKKNAYPTLPEHCRSIQVGPLQCNMTIVSDPETKEAVLCDPGGHPEDIIKLIEEMGVKVVQIVVTHGHLDHFLAAKEIHDYTGAPIHLHEGDNMLWTALPMQCMLLQLPAPAAAIPAPHGKLEDGAKLSVLDGRVIHTPGHSPGSSCFYFESLNLLLSGDTLFRGSIGRTDLFGGDKNAIVRSIREKLYTLPADTVVVPGHGDLTTIGFESKYNAIVRSAM